MSTLSGGFGDFPMSKRRRTTKSASAQTALVPVSARKAEQNQASTIRRLVKLTRGIAPEVKLLDYTYAVADCSDATGSTASVLPIAQGTAIDNRIGHKIRVKRLIGECRIDTSINSLGTTPSAGEFTRFFLVLDKQVVADTAASAATVFTSPFHPEFPTLLAVNQGRFKILWQSPLIVHARIAQSSLQGAITTPLTPSQNSVHAYNLKLDLPVTYNGTAAGDFNKNCIFQICMTSLAADTLDFDSRLRVEFIDD